MEKFVYKYLSLTYKLGLVSDVKKNHLVIYDKLKNENVYGNELLKELDNIFNVGELNLRIWVEIWAQSLKKYKVDLTWFWLRESYSFPSVDRIMANTLAMDLINIQPLNSPKSSLFFLDFKQTIKEAIEEYDHQVDEIDIKQTNDILNVNINIKPKQGVKFIETKITIGKNNEFDLD